MAKRSKPIYVYFDVPDDLVRLTYQAIQAANESGKVKRGTNETTKSVERGLAKLVVIAEDVDPPEIVAHLPDLCAEKKIPYTYVPSKADLGKATGIDVSAASACIIDPGDAADMLNELLSKLEKIRASEKS